MKRMWWGLLGVAVLASSTGCRSTCGQSQCGKLFNRESCDVPAGQLTSRACGDATPLGYPMTSGPGYPGMPGGSPAPTDMIPPPFVPAVPVPAVPGNSAKNVLPMPIPISPPTSAVGLPR